MVIKFVDTKLNAFDIYEIFYEDAFSFILDSSMNEKTLGRFSFIGSKPFLIFKSKERKIEIIEQKRTRIFEGDPFAEISNLLSRYKSENSSELPFTGGAVGYLSYDLCHHTENLPKTAIDDMNIPDAFLGFYDGVIAYDHFEKKCYVIANGFEKDASKIIEELHEKIKQGIGKNKNVSNKSKNGRLHTNITKTEYIDAIKKVKNYIREGDVYQVNFTYRFDCNINEKPISVYKKLRRINPAPFSSFMSFDDVKVLSSSPERFMKIKDRQMETRPIKGTCPRGENENQDSENCSKLLHSEKDNAELMMIVDLERNDLGRVSKAGSVRVKEPLHLEKYATVNHLVASVVGELDDKFSSMDGIKAAFPGGSITGAPKIRAMEIIDELETNSRNIYTGCVGYMGFDGDADLNIAIRTIVIKEKTAYFHVGGGIVWDSDPEAEYRETFDKAKALIEVLQS